MARQPKPLFLTQLLDPEISVSVKRFLSRVDRQNSSLLKLAAACTALGLKPVIAFHFNDCCAHLGIPDKKTAVYIRQSVDTGDFRKVKASWDASEMGHSWKLLFTTNRQIDSLPPEALKQSILNFVGAKR